MLINQLSYGLESLFNDLIYQSVIFIRLGLIFLVFLRFLFHQLKVRLKFLYFRIKNG